MYKIQNMSDNPGEGKIAIVDLSAMARAAAERFGGLTRC